MADSIDLREALVASEERYRRLLEYSPVAIAIHVTGTLRYVNSAGARLFGVVAADELLGRSFFDFVSPDYQDFILRPIRQVESDGKTAEFVPARFIRVNREEIDVEVFSTSTIFEGQSATQVIVREAADQRAVVQALRREEEQLQLLVQASGVVLGSLNLDQVLSRILKLAKDHIAADAYAVWRYHEPTAEWQTVASDDLSSAYQAAAIRAMNHATSMPDAPLVVENLDREPLLARHREMHRLQGTQALLVVPLPIDNAIVGTLAFYYHQPHHFTDSETHVATALANLAGAAIGTAELYQDQARLRAEAEAAIQARDQFLALVAHDLRNPLAVAKARTQLLQRRLNRSDGQLNPVQVVEGLAQIASSVDHTLDLLKDLLNVARGQADELIELNRQPTDLVALVYHVARNFEHMDSHHQILVETQITALIGNWNASRLERVLENLLTNAIKYSPRGGPIIIGVDRSDEPGSLQAILTVRDRGIGIPPSDLPYIFEPFRRGQNVAGHAEGFGIGLVGVQQMIKQHGGTIDVISEVNRGSTFTIHLPLQPDGETTEQDRNVLQ